MLFVYVFGGGVYGRICYSLGEKYFYMELKKKKAGCRTSFACGNIPVRPSK